MTRAWPLGILFFVFIWLTANVESWLIWLIAGIFFVALIVLIFAMKSSGNFVGPSTLIDDMKYVGKRMVSSDDEDIAIREAERTAADRELEDDLEDYPEDQPSRETATKKDY